MEERKWDDTVDKEVHLTTPDLIDLLTGHIREVIHHRRDSTSRPFIISVMHESDLGLGGVKDILRRLGDLEGFVRSYYAEYKEDEPEMTD